MTYLKKLRLHRDLHIALAVLAAAIIIIFVVRSSKPETPAPDPEPTQTESAFNYQLTAYTWAMVWCESRGVPGAINPKDVDGRQSWGILQFRPETFAGYREKYGLPPADLMDPEAQLETFGHMLRDPKVKFDQEFPDCVKKKIGRPPIL